MFISPYDTTVCKSYRMDLIRRDLVALHIEGLLRHYRENIFILTPNDPQVKPFIHPLTVDGVSVNNYKEIIVIDGRGNVRFRPNTEELILTPEFYYQFYRAMLMLKGWGNNSSDLYSCGDLQIKIFSKLLGENIAKRLGLEITTKVTIEVIAAYYYMCLFSNVNDFDLSESNIIGMARQISRNVYLPVDKVLSIIDQLEYMPDLESFNEAIVKVTQSVRLEKLKAGFIMTILGGIWFGSNNVEQVAVALEHPPTFNAMLYQVCMDKGYRKTLLAQLVDNSDKNNLLTEPYVLNINRLITVD